MCLDSGYIRRTKMASGSTPFRSSNSSAFSPKSRCGELWYVSPPTIHMAAIATGGLKTLYENIDKKRSQQHLTPNDGVSDDSRTCCTNIDGQFDPPNGMHLLANRYRYLETVATGHTAIVVKAEDTLHDNQLVIIKVLHEQYFLIGGQEADILQEVNCADPRELLPIIRLRNLFRFQNHYCLVFDTFDHEPLIHRFSQKGWIGQKSLKIIKVVATQLLLALSFLHNKNIIHADLKPENILFVKDECPSLDVRIADFGNSIRCTSDEIALYEEDYELQTIMYRAPEVMFGVGIGFGIDMWSIGCILVELYLGKPLFEGETKIEVLTNMFGILGTFPGEFLNGKFGKQFERFLGDRLTFQEIIPRLQKHLGCMDYEFLHFVAGFLNYKPVERPSCWNALCSPFLAQYYPLRHIIPTNVTNQMPYSSLTLRKEDYNKYINHYSSSNIGGIKKPCLQVNENCTKELLSTIQASKKLKTMEITVVTKTV